MKRHGILLLLVLLGALSTAHGSLEWHWLHPYPSGSHVNGISFTGENTGWLATSGGEVFFTDNGGVSWILQCNNTSESYQAIEFFNGEFGVCAGIDGTQGVVLTTANGGADWEATPCSKPLFGVEVFDSNYATAVGWQGAIFRTMTGGATWSLQGTGLSTSLQDVSFASPSHGWACGEEGVLLHTETYGAFWYELDVPLSDYWGVHFTDTQNGYLAGTPYILYTDDGGDSWSTAASGDGIKAIDIRGSTGAAVDAGGAILSFDGGASWSGEPVPCMPLAQSQPDLLDCSVTPSGEVFISGQYGFSAVRDASGEWSPLSTCTTTEDLTAITHAPDNSIHACGENGAVLRSLDGGVSWSAQIIDEDYSFKDISFPTPSVGYACARSSSTAELVVMKTEDSGATWFRLSSAPQTGIYTASIDFIDADNGVAVLNSGHIYTTTDGGATWTDKTSFSVSPWRVRFGDTDRGWISCAGGEIICFDFDSDSWSQQVVPFNNYLKGLFALNQDTVWAAGWNGAVLRTNNGGLNWNIIQSSGPVDWIDIAFAPDGTTGYLLSSQRVGFTENGGYSIEVFPSFGSAGEVMTAISVSSSGDADVSRYNGGVIRLFSEFTGAEDSRHTTVPPAGGLAVSRNPFIETTSISLTLAGSETLEMHIYDISGRVVQTLHTGEILPGEHSFQVDGSPLAPGIYFARAVTADAVYKTSLIRLR